MKLWTQIKTFIIHAVIRRSASSRQIKAQIAGKDCQSRNTHH